LKVADESRVNASDCFFILFISVRRLLCWCVFIADFPTSLEELSSKSSLDFFITGEYPVLAGEESFLFLLSFCVSPWEMQHVWFNKLNSSFCFKGFILATLITE